MPVVLSFTLLSQLMSEKFLIMCLALLLALLLAHVEISICSHTVSLRSLTATLYDCILSPNSYDPRISL